jgi:LmbE family N-acetylglucosaminyl deacetylase
VWSSFWCVVFSATPVREGEALAIAAVFLEFAREATVTVKTFRESYFPYVAADIKDCFEELKTSYNPEVVFSHHRHDRHQDHKTIAEFTWNTFRNHLIVEYEIAKYEGDLWSPYLFVPLSRQVAERKVELLLEHFVSQGTRSWFRAETFRGLMSIRGVECNAPEGFAEAFHAAKLVL